MDEVRKKLDEEIIAVIGELKKMDPGCDAFSAATDDLSALWKLRNEDQNFEMERLRIESETKKDEIKKRSEEKNRNLDRWTNVGTTVVSVVLPIAASVGLTMIGYCYEQIDVVGSPILKGLVQNTTHMFRGTK